MTKFNCNDFLSDKLPKGGLYSSVMLRDVIKRDLDITGKVNHIVFGSRVYNNEVLYQWIVFFDINEVETGFIYPAYVPEDPQKAKLVMKKHQDSVNAEFFVYSDGDYLLWGGKYPCQVHIDDNENIFIKKVEIWASQKMVQDFLSLIIGDDVCANLVICTSQIGSSERYNCIGWSAYANEREMFVSLVNVIYGFELFAKLIETRTIEVGTTFGINLQRYAVAEDKENGLYLCKVN